MSDSVTAIFDGTVFRPTDPVALSPDTKVRLTVEPVAPTTEASFFDVALSVDLQGPPDWSANFRKYLSGELKEGE